MKEYTIVGLMSGTSLDGVDLALCNFKNQNNKWTFTIQKAQTIPYDAEWKTKLATAHTLTGLKLIELHKEYGHYLGNLICNFIKGYKNQINGVASHGHTIFHQPERRLTFQLGDGTTLAMACKLPVISDFRSLDVAHGGQGAPLVPIGDKLLFSDYPACLNLGGFANISFDKNKKRIAFDICPANIVINYLSNLLNTEFDKDGLLGKKGEINNKLLIKLNNIAFYQKQPPKSLGREWLNNEIFPILNKNNISIQDKLRTIYEHIAIQIATIINTNSLQKILVTGGGAYNIYLIELLKSKTSAKIIIPDKILIEFKEALIFAFLGVLRLLNKPNCLSSVTGATQDVCGGIISLPY